MSVVSVALVTIRGRASGSAARGREHRRQDARPGSLELEGGNDGCVVGFGVLAVGREGDGFVVEEFIVDL